MEKEIGKEAYRSVSKEELSEEAVDKVTGR